MSHNELYAILAAKLSTKRAYGDGKHFPVLSGNMNACIVALRKCFSSEEEMNSDRKNIEDAILASRPLDSPYNTDKHVKTRYLALRKKFVEELS